MKKMILLLSLLLSAEVFASNNEAPDWWSTSECRHKRNLTYLKLLKDGWSSKDATERVDENFKSCICLLNRPWFSRHSPSSGNSVSHTLLETAA